MEKETGELLMRGEKQAKKSQHPRLAKKY